MADAKQVQIRRGTNAQCIAATLASSEVVRDTTNNRLIVHDGSRLGGWALPNFSDIQTNYFGYPSVSGSANAITFTFPIQPLAWTAGMEWTGKLTANNTNTVTAAITGLGGTKNCVAVKDNVLSALEADDLTSGVGYRFYYDGTQVQVSGLNEAQQSDAGWNLLAVATGGGASYDFTDISGDYTNYAWVLKNVHHSVQFATPNLIMRCRRSGQGSFDASGYSSNLLNGSTGNNTNSGLYIKIFEGVAPLQDYSKTGVSGVIYGHNLGAAAYATFNGHVSIMYVGGGSDAGSNYSRVINGGLHTTTAIDAVQFKLDTESMNATSEISMYGLNTTL